MISLLCLEAICVSSQGLCCMECCVPRLLQRLLPRRGLYCLSIFACFDHPRLSIFQHCLRPDQGSRHRHCVDHLWIIDQAEIYCSRLGEACRTNHQVVDPIRIYRRVSEAFYRFSGLRAFGRDVRKLNRKRDGESISFANFFPCPSLVVSIFPELCGSKRTGRRHDCENTSEQNRNWCAPFLRTDPDAGNVLGTAVNKHGRRSPQHRHQSTCECADPKYRPQIELILSHPRTLPPTVPSRLAGSES